MNERKILPWGGYFGAVALFIALACIPARFNTPISVIMPDGAIIKGRCFYGNPQALLDANGIRVSGLDRIFPGDEPGIYVLKHPTPVTFRGPGGFVRRTFTHAATVGQFLAESGIEPGPLDIVEPPEGNPLPTSGEVRLTKVEHKMLTTHEEIPFNSILELTPTLRRGQEEIIRHGVAGEKEVTYELTLENGAEVKRRVLNENTLRQSIDQKSMVGIYTDIVADRQLIARKILWMQATAYDPGVGAKKGSAGNRTAMGLKPGRGIVAVDPKVIPLGSRLFIEGYGHAIAGDTGGAIKGLRIDLGFGTRKEAIQFGRRNVKVYIIE